MGWDEDRFMESVKRICRDSKVVNNTDFNYSYCNCFDIESNLNHDEHDFVVTFKTSLVADAYSLHVTRYSKNRRSGKVVQEDECDELLSVVANLREFAHQQGLREISCAEHDIVVAGVSLELSDVATLGKCLFDDFE